MNVKGFFLVVGWLILATFSLITMGNLMLINDRLDSITRACAT